MWGFNKDDEASQQKETLEWRWYWTQIDAQNKNHYLRIYHEQKNISTLFKDVKLSETVLIYVNQLQLYNSERLNVAPSKDFTQLSTTIFFLSVSRVV